jgi:heme oxygenase
MTQPSKEAQLRAERLARALRANLGRRKSQARGRDSVPVGESATEEAEAKQEGDAEKPQKETG